MANNPKDTANKKTTDQSSHLHLVPFVQETNVLELFHPGSFATLENQPHDLPPFQVIHCKGGRCWVRQQAWGKHIHWEVAHSRLKSA